MYTLKTAAIDSKGYGKIYKKQMKDIDVSLVAKGLLAYLSSYAGSGTVAFPKREKILRDMDICKDSFAKHMTILEKAEYISRHKTAAGTMYEILTTTSDANGAPIELKSMGYGTVPKLVMLDSTLSARAKGVYAYMCSYAGAGSSAYPHLRTILKDLDIGKSAYYGYYNELVSHGYISVVQSVDAQGKFGPSTYTLNEVVYMDSGKGSDIDTTSTVENHVENLVESGEDPRPVSDKSIPGKTASRIFGRAYNNNNLITNNPLSYDKGYISNTPAPSTEAAVENSQALSRPEVKEWMGYPQLIADAKSWADVKEILGHFIGPVEKNAYLRHCKEVADELSRQFYLFFRRTASVVIISPKAYRYADLCQNLMSVEREELSNLCLETADKGNEIRCLSKYMSKVVLNRAAKGVLPM